MLSCDHHSPTRLSSPPSSAGGFTLLELLVVMALIALMAGVALPNFSRLLEGYENTTKWSRLTADIDGLPSRAYAQSRILILRVDNATTLLPSIPDGWKIRIDKPIRYRENGWCEGGRIVVTTNQGEARSYDLAAPQCAVDRKP